MQGAGSGGRAGVRQGRGRRSVQGMGWEGVQGEQDGVQGRGAGGAGGARGAGEKVRGFSGGSRGCPGVGGAPRPALSTRGGAEGPGGAGGRGGGRGQLVWGGLAWGTRSGTGHCQHRRSLGDMERPGGPGSLGGCGRFRGSRHSETTEDPAGSVGHRDPGGTQVSMGRRGPTAMLPC